MNLSKHNQLVNRIAKELKVFALKGVALTYLAHQLGHGLAPRVVKAHTKPPAAAASAVVVDGPVTMEQSG